MLSLCISSDGSSVFASGVDPVLVQFELVPVTEGGEWKNWVRSNVRSRHSHDVRSVALAGDWVASGGQLVRYDLIVYSALLLLTALLTAVVTVNILDSNPCVLNARKF